jgi:hypothetical protein
MPNGLSARLSSKGQKKVMATSLIRRLVNPKTLVLGAVAVVAYRKLRAPRMPYIGSFERALAAKQGKPAARALAQRIQARYEKLFAERPQQQNVALRFHLERNIIPALALYQILREDGMSLKEGLVEVDRILTATFDAGFKLLALPYYLTDGFSYLRKTTPGAFKYAFPNSRFNMTLEENSPQTLAINVHTCFYLDIMNQNNARELTSIFCKMDDLLMAKMPRSIRWERTQTLATGGEFCNFRWSKGN